MRSGQGRGEPARQDLALHGADPYWGRVLSELGSSGADFDLDKVALSYGRILVFQRWRWRWPMTAPPSQASTRSGDAVEMLLATLGLW